MLRWGLCDRGRGKGYRRETGDSVQYIRGDQAGVAGGAACAQCWGRAGMKKAWTQTPSSSSLNELCLPPHPRSMAIFQTFSKEATQMEMLFHHGEK